MIIRLFVSELIHCYLIEPRIFESAHLTRTSTVLRFCPKIIQILIFGIFEILLEMSLINSTRIEGTFVQILIRISFLDMSITNFVADYHQNCIV